VAKYKEVLMGKPISVWVQRFTDRPHLVLQWFDPDTGKRRSKSAETADPAKAEEAREKLQYELRNDKYQEASTLTWKAFRELYEADYLPDCRPRTRDKVATVLNAFEAVCNPRQMHRVNERMISLFVAGLRKRKGRDNGHMGRTTIRVHLAFLQSMLRWAVDQKILTACPKFPSIKVAKKKPQPVPTETFECLFAKAPDQQTRVFLLCGWRAGLRLNEAFELEWEQTDKAPWIDFAGKRIWLPGACTKGTEDAWLPLDPALQEALQTLPRHGRKVFRFESKRDAHLVQAQAVGHRICALARKAGVRLTMKGLRRGFGCYYAARESAHVLQKLMRHANIQTTLDYYANFDPAVENAVFSRSNCNDLCNKTALQPEGHERSSDVKGDSSGT
jgi:integrase